MKGGAGRQGGAFWGRLGESLRRDFLPLASGRESTAPARLLHPLMRMAAFAYGKVVLLRNRLYEGGLLRRLAPPLPVISVGNITVGGTGKTPFVEYTARLLLKMGRQPAVIARGYGPPAVYQKEPGGNRLSVPVNDEGLLVSRNLPGVPVLLSPDRLAACFRALELGADCAVLDDAFQHLSLERDLDVVLLDATVPLGFGRMLPRGLLREPLRGLARADAIVINRVDLARDGDIVVVEGLVSRAAPGKPVFLACQRPHRLVSVSDGGSLSVRELEDCPIGTFCGLGNPYPFGLTLRRLGAEVVYAKRFPDHHFYRAEEVEAVAGGAARAGAKMLVMTQKDAVKIAPTVAAALRLPAYYLAIRAALLEREAEYAGLLQEALGARMLEG